eukprot:scaffold40675_cov47-Phaeocystis_antarctica.AAC.2
MEVSPRNTRAPHRQNRCIARADTHTVLDDECYAYSPPAPPAPPPPELKRKASSGPVASAAAAASAQIDRPRASVWCVERTRAVGDCVVRPPGCTALFSC